jgi:YebC/PmpR family DNA-binding regulatory protein
MSGHSKWSTIKHKKAALDAKRGKAWSKHARAITMAAKIGGGNPNDNPRLRLAIDKAKGDNMPKDTIEKAIKKGTGELAGETYEDVLYEGYGPGGVAVMARAMTDNRNRTAGEIKKVFERSGGNLGSPNCVSFQFQQKGVILIAGDKCSEDRIMEVIESADRRMVSNVNISLEIETARKAMRLIDALEDHDDVDAVYSNIDLSDEVVAQLAKE